MHGGRVGSDKALIGKQYAATSWASASVDLKAFAAATNDTHPSYTGLGGVMQPMAVVLATASLGVAQVVSDQALIGDDKRLLKLLHRAEGITWARELRVGEAFVVRTKLAAIETTAAGETLHIETCLYQADAHASEQWVVRAHTALFIRERTRMPPRIKQPAVSSQAAAPRVLRTYEATWQIPSDQAARYAHASGDNNPIHLDDKVAQQAGLKGRVVHGLCTMAFAARAVCEGFADSTPGRLRQLAVGFARPVYLGECLVLTAQQSDDGRITFVVRNAEGRLVLENGVATIASAAA